MPKLSCVFAVACCKVNYDISTPLEVSVKFYGNRIVLARAVTLLPARMLLCSPPVSRDPSRVLRREPIVNGIHIDTLITSSVAPKVFEQPTI